MNLPHLLRPAPLRRRLWQLSVLLAIVIFTFAAGNFFLPADKAVSSRTLGHDFVAFYTAGTFVREGRTQDLYDLKKVADYQETLAVQAGLDAAFSYDSHRFGPWWNPPFYAWIFVPLTLLPFHQAVAVWTAINVVALVFVLMMLMRMLAPRWMERDAADRAVDWKTLGLVPFLVLLSMPFMQAIGHGQNTFISLCILCIVVRFWRCKRAILAGAFCALLGYKPQLAAVVACALIFSLGFRAIIGLSLAGSTMVLLTQWSMPGAMVDWLRRLPVNIRYMQIDHAYMWERHGTLKSFWRLLFQGRDAGELTWLTTAFYAISLLTIAGLLLRVVWSHVRERHSVDDTWGLATQKVWRDRLIGATLCAAPLLMPFYFDYDLLLLSIPATLFAAEMLTRPTHTLRDRWLARLWIALYAWMLVNPPVSSVTHINGNVILLGIICILMLQRATRPLIYRAHVMMQHEPQTVKLHQQAA
jgi:hypothetical protein